MISLPNNRIHISGGGLVGALAATQLAQLGYQVTLLEKRSDIRKQKNAEGRSINLAVSTRGIYALKNAGLWDRVRAEAIAMPGREIHDLKGNTQFQPYSEYRPDGRDPCIYSVSRAELNRILLRAAEDTGRVELRFESGVQSVDVENKSLLTEKGETISYDLLLGADGAASPVRHSLMAYLKSKNHSDLDNRLVPLGHSYKELTIPPGEGDKEGQFKIKKSALHIWPRGQFMFIALPNFDGSFTCTLFLPDEGKNSFADLTSGDRVQEFFQEYFPDVLGLIPNLSESFEKNPLGILGTLRAQPWVIDDQIALMGDAAHAVVPFFGQGMNCGFEDCTELLNQIAKNSNWKSCLAEYGKIRKPEGDSIADMALENYIEMRDSVGNAEFLKRKAIELELERRFPSQYISRYSLVSFSTLPYSEAKRLGKVQAQLIDQICKRFEQVDQIDWTWAESALAQSQIRYPGL